MYKFGHRYKVAPECAYNFFERTYQLEPVIGNNEFTIISTNEFGHPYEINVNGTIYSADDFDLVCILDDKDEEYLIDIDEEIEYDKIESIKDKINKIESLLAEIKEMM